MRRIRKARNRHREDRYALYNRSLRLESLEERALLSTLAAPQSAISPLPPPGGDSPTIRPISPEWFGTLAEDGPIQNQWMVQLSGAALVSVEGLSDTPAIFAPGNLQVVRGLGMHGQLLVQSTGDHAAAESWLRHNPNIAHFSKNATVSALRTPNDSSFSQLWGLHNTGQTGGTVDADIDAPEAWDLLTGSSQVVVGVIDTGVNYNHPDLAANMWRNPGEIAGNFIDDDANGFVDDVYGYNFVSNNGNSMDDHSHGTHVAGTIAGVGDNSAGVAGVNWTSSIMALKFLNSSGSGSTSNAVRAVNYATMMKSSYGVNLKLTNNSWGGGGYDQALYDAIAANGAANMLFIAAAGNNGYNIDSYASYPAGYNLSSIVSVAATDHRDYLANFSNYGITNVDLAAPGVSIYSTVLGSSYSSFDGTSMASPHVAGVAALAWAYSSTSTAAQIRTALLAGADRIPSLTNSVATGGRLNARGTLMQLGMNVMSSTPAKNARFTAPPTSVTIDFTHPYDPATVQASDLTMAGVTASSWVAVDADSITFQFDVSPVSGSGAQVIAIAADAIRRLSDGDAIDPWQNTFYYDSLPLAIVSSTPALGATVTLAPTQLILNFNEPINTSSVQASDLKLDFGSVTAVSIIDTDSIAFTIGGLIRDGVVNYTLVDGSVTDPTGNPNPPISGSFSIDDPLVQRYTSTDVPKSINDLMMMTSTLTINTPIAIADLDVELSILHPNAADLDVFLVAPDGTRVELFTDVGGSGDDFTGTILDDEGVNTVALGVAPFTGRYRPEGSLSLFDGFNALGTWTLQITDDASGNTGTLVDWGLRITNDLTLAPRISSVQPLPVNGGGTWAQLSTLTVRFSEVMDAATVNDPTNWSLVAAGADNIFDTADDVPISTSVSPAYSAGLNATLAISPAPLAPATYRLRATAGLRDLAGNLLDGNGDGTAGDAYARTFAVRPQANVLPFSEGFEAGSLASLGGYWEFVLSSTGRATVTATGSPHSGTSHLLLDQTAAYAGPQHAILHVDLLGKTNVTLDFWQKEFGDRSEVTDDRVQISANGITWYTIINLTGDNSDPEYQHHAISLDAAIATAGISYTRDFQIRFSQDNYYLASGGFAFDDVRISQMDFNGARVTSQSPASGPQLAGPFSSFTVTFNEAIDPASFTAADIKVFDPAGGTVVISGTPVPSADNETFTMTFATPQTLVGTYKLQVGPDVLDVNGNPMNQDADGISGEATDFYSGTFTVGPAEPQAFPYSQGFETGDLGSLAGWKFTAATGSIDITTSGAPHGGTSQLRMIAGDGISRDGVLVMNMSGLAGRTDLTLDFWMKQLVTTTSHSLRLAVSGSGTSFSTIVTTLVNPTADTFQHYAFDLDSALSSKGIALDSDVYIRFEQNAFTSGRTIVLDDIRVSAIDEVGPRIGLFSTLNPDGTFTVTFNEPVDPQTFTASDVSIIGPTGHTQSLVGQPVPSADNRTFTLQVPTATAGAFRVSIGPDIRDSAGNAMDQDSDGIAGEATDYITLAFTVGPTVPQAFPYSQGFESGSTSTLPGWSFATTGTSQMTVTAANGPLGAYHLRFDNSSNYDSQTATLALDLASQVGATNLALDFALKSVNTLSNNGVTVSVSGDGTNFTSIDNAYSLVSTTAGQYTTFSIDLDAALASRFIAIDANVYIRFLHEGSSSTQATLDNVRVSNADVFGPRVTSLSPVAGINTFTVTFNEAVDPATFTAADIVINGPAGFPVAVAGNPAPSAGNLTFTVTMASAIAGAHAVKIGPDVRDAAGNQMNQDNDFVSGEGTADQFAQSFTVGPPVAQAVPYTQGFEGGSLAGLAGWSFSVTGDGTTEVTTANSPRGNYHLKFDQATAGTKTATLLLDLSSQIGRTDLTFDFWSQSPGTLSSVSLQASGNGTTFSTIPTSLFPTQYARYAIDLDAVLASLNIAMDSDVYLRFQHTGGSATQELTLDDVRISNVDVLGPKVTANSFVNAGSSLTVTFDEAIDPATFAAADVVIGGPTGATVSLVGNPVPDAANRVFTLNLATTVFGSYSLRVGPNIADLVGNLQNQDGDTVFGENTQDVFSGSFTVWPPAAQTLPYVQGFDSGSFTDVPGWGFTTGLNGKLELATTNQPRSGNYHLKFGQTGTSTQQAVLALNLSDLAGATDLSLDFWLKSLASSNSNTMGLAVSGDGAAWTAFPQASAIVVPATNQYTRYVFDLDAAMQVAGVSADADVYVRFLHSATLSTDEMTLEDVRVLRGDLIGPTIVSQTVSAATSSVSITFNEPIDPTTFTAADVTVRGPMGYAVALIGNPVPSADNRTFTLTLASATTGNYSLTVGPDVRDFAGNVMNQDNDPLTGETNGHDDYESTFEFGPLVARTYPYQQDFESFGSTGIAGWSFATTGTGAIDLVTTDSPHGGSSHVKFDQTTTTGSQSATMMLDLTSQAAATDLELDFWVKLNSSGGHGFGILVSGDGVSWINTFTPSSSPSGSPYLRYAIDLDAALNAANVARDNSVYIKFYHEGLSATSEMWLDDVRISNVDVFGPRVSSVTTVPGEQAFTVNFNEPIDPATLTLEDVTLTSPIGIAMTLAAPVANAQNTSFRYDLPTNILGAYTLRVGPDVRDAAGNLMNQDADPISGEATGDSYSGNFTISSTTPVPFPYVQDFEAGQIGLLQGLNYAVTNTGVIELVNTRGPRGNYHLLLDQTSSSGSQSVVLMFDLSQQLGANNLALDFWANSLNVSNSLSVEVSGNGTSYNSVGSVTLPTLNQYVHVSYDLDAALTTAGIAFDNSVYVRLSHTGFSSSYEVTLDDLRLSTADVFGPRATTHQTTTTSNTFTVTFNEAIDPATFTAADITLTSPTGFPLAVTVDPVVSADQRTFTITLPGAARGTYGFKIGPDVRDLAGNWMNQDNDALEAETADAYSGTFVVGPPTPQAFPYVEGFEGGSVNALASWTFGVTSSGTVEVTSANSPYEGNFHLKFDQTGSGNGLADVVVDLSGQAAATNLSLDFWLKSVGTAVGGDYVNVRLSNNGVSYTTASGGSGLSPTVLNQQTHFTIDLDAALKTANITFDGDVYIRFQRVSFGDFYEMTLDNVRVSNFDMIGPRVTSHSATASGSAFTVTFDEPIDPATFTASDVVLKGPHGLVIGMAGNPIPSADNRTFTINLSSNVAGVHTFTIGPDVRDLAGNWMNQDSDGNYGEPTVDAYNGSFLLSALAQRLPLVQDFESGVINNLPGFQFAVTGTGTFEVTSVDSPRGGYHLKLDQTTLSEKAATIVLDLSNQAGATDLGLEFWLKRTSTFSTSVKLSGDGTTWSTLSTDLAPNVNTYTRIAYDLDAALATAGIALDDTVYVQISSTASTATSEITIDDLRIANADVLGPRVLSHQTSTATDTFTVTFNEAIDPATFTAADISIVGPTGAAVALIGNPVPSADQRTYTLQLGSAIGGSYRFTITSDVRDLVGLPLNQDNSPIAGETNGNDNYAGSFTLGPPTAQAFPYLQDFDSGNFNALAGWSFGVTGSSTLVVSNINSPRGTNHLRMLHSGTATEYAGFVVDLSSQASATNLVLDFWQKEISVSSSIDVQVSGDGVTYTTISQGAALSPPAAGSYTHFAFDLDAALTAAAVTPDADVFIRFLQNRATATLELTLDDVRVSAVDSLGPQVTSIPATATGNTFTITFNEPIDPATFLSSDVILTGPTGYAVLMVGNPVPSADNRTFTVTVSGGVPGKYSVRVGPDVRDTAGNWMNQDGDPLTGETLQDAFNSTFVLGVPAAQPFPYEQGFNTTDFSSLAGWSFAVSGTGTLDLTTIASPRGTSHLKFDQTSSGSSTSQGDLVLDLSSQAGATNLALDFYLQTITNNAANALTIWGSNDGLSWSSLQQANAIAPTTINTYLHYSYDLDAALAAAGIALDSSVYLRFAHAGTATSHEMTVDDLRITNLDVFGPKVVSQSSSAAARTITVTFDEAIDPATFNASNVVAVGPTGTVFPFTGTPVVSEDNLTFTVTLASTLPGAHTLRIGPDVRDLAGNSMNQDADVIQGESTDFFVSSPLVFGPPTARAFPFVEDFESGDLGQLTGLSYSYTGTGTTELSTVNGPRGLYHLRFDQSATGTSTQQLVLLVDLASQASASNLELDFLLQALTSTSTVDVHISHNGTSWLAMPQGLSLSPALNQYTRYSFDLDAALSSLGIIADSDVYVRFTHNATSATQEMTLDDIRISNVDAFGPRVISSSPTGLVPVAPVTVTVTFNEAIDPATFTAADVTLLSSMGTAMAIHGEPVASADNRTFTINFTPTFAGTYTLRVGPDVRDLAGNLMNQDNDAGAGEAGLADQYSMSIVVGPPVAQTLPYVQHFDSSDPAALAGLSFAMTGSGTAAISGVNAPYSGSGHLKLAQSGFDASTQEVRLVLDLSAHVGASNLVLDFWHTIITGTYSVNVMVSGDGVTWYTAMSMGGGAAGINYHEVLDLDQPLSNTGIALDSDVYVRLVHNNSSPTTEVAIDQLRVYRGNLNRAPTLNFISTAFGTEDSSLNLSYSSLYFSSDMSDTSGGTLQFRIESVLNGTLTKNGVVVDPMNTFLAFEESLAWTPPANANGNVNAFTVRGYDGDLLSGRTVTVAVSLSQVNDAPVLNNSGDVWMPTITEDIDTFVNQGMLVSQLLTSVSPIDMVTDIDGPVAEGIAIIDGNRTSGTWEYSTFGSWSPVFSSSQPTAARLLAADASTRVRFRPNLNFNGTLNASLTFRAWDQSQNSNGTLLIIATVGGTTAYSDATETASIIVTPTNDRPVVVSGTPLTLTPIMEDAIDNAGMLVSAFINSSAFNRITDVDVGAVEGLAIVGTSSFGGGQWQYSIDNGQNWGPLANTFAFSARLLAADTQTRIRFVPSANFFGFSTNEYFRFRAWDQTSGANGSLADAMLTSSFSMEEQVGYINVSPVADTPRVDTAMIVEELHSVPLIIRRHLADSTEVTHFKIDNIVGGTLYLYPSGAPVVNGTFVTATQAQQGVQFKASEYYVSQASFQVAASQDGVNVSPQSGWATSTLPVRPIGDPPQVPAITTLEDTLSPLIVIDRHVTDGPEISHFQISSIIGGTLYHSDGATQISNGNVITYDQAHSGLRFLPSADFVGTAQFRVLPIGTDMWTSYPSTATVTVTPVNDAPTGVSLSATSIVENMIGAVVGNLAIADVDQDDTHTLHFSDDRFEVANGQLRLKSNVWLDYEGGETISLTITATDAAGSATTREFSLQIQNVNERPLGLALTGTELIANRPAGLETLIAVMAFDADQGDQLSFALSDDRFEIVDNVLRVRSDRRYDFGEYALVSLGITATDQGGLRLSDSFNVTVSLENEAPFALALASTPVAENTPGASIGSVAIFDRNSSDTHTLYVTDSRFEVFGDQLRLKPGQTLDYESATDFVLQVTAIDDGGASYSQSVTIALSDLPESPTAVDLSRASVFNHLPGAWVAALDVQDPDRVNEYEYEVSDSRFVVRGGQLYLHSQVMIDEPAGSTLPIDITVNDVGAGASYVQSLLLEVMDRPTDWTAPLQWRPNPADVNADGVVTPLDALLVILQLNAGGSGSHMTEAAGGTLAPSFFDVSGDEYLSPLDALLIINHLNARDSAQSQASDVSHVDAAFAEGAFDNDDDFQLGFWAWQHDEQRKKHKLQA